MSSDERKIYDLVVRRFAAVLYPPCEYEQTTLKGMCGGETFSAKGRVMKQPGWQAAYEDFQEEVSEEDIREQLLPEIKEGTSQMVKLIKINEGKTKPCLLYTSRCV